MHRLLSAAIDIASLSNDMTDKFKLSKQCDQMNRKNRMAQQASQASVQFNTFQFFKLQKNKDMCFTRGIVMRITQGAGIYVQIQKYGIEGLLVEDQEEKSGEYRCLKIIADNDSAILKCVDKSGKAVEQKVQQFDHMLVEISATMVEFRRSIKLHYRGPLDSSKGKIDEA